MSALDTKLLEKYGRTVLGGWASAAPIESLSAADGSNGLQYPTDIPDTVSTLVFHGREAVSLLTTSDAKMNDVERNTLREATRTVVRTMRFR